MITYRKRRDIMKKERDLIHGPLIPNMFLYAIPVLISGIIQLLYNAADIVVVGRFDGKEALGAVGCCGTIAGLVTNLVIGLSVGGGVLTAFHFGAKNKHLLSKTVHTAILIGILGGILVGGVGYFISEPMHHLLKTPDGILPLAVIYLKICFIGMPGLVVYNFGAAILRSLGDTKRPLWILIFTGLVNVGLNLLLVIVFSLGVVGVAIATITAQALSAIMVTLCLMKRTDAARFSYKLLRLDKDLFIQMLKIGIPAGIQSSVFSISNLVIQLAMNTFGEDAVAGNAAAANIDGFIFMATNAFYHAALTFVGQLRGAGKIKRIPYAYATAACYALAIWGVLYGVIFFFGENLLSIYAPGEAQVIAYGMNRLHIIAFSYAVMGLLDVSQGVLRGLGISFVPMCISILGICGVRIAWISLVFPRVKTLECIYYSYPFSWITTCTVMTCLAIWHIRKLIVSQRSA